MCGDGVHSPRATYMYLNIASHTHPRTHGAWGPGGSSPLRDPGAHVGQAKPDLALTRSKMKKKKKKEEGGGRRPSCALQV
eukprot:910632-Prymnesium_polylepis.2